MSIEPEDLTTHTTSLIKEYAARADEVAATKAGGPLEQAAGLWRDLPKPVRWFVLAAIALAVYLIPWFEPRIIYTQDTDMTSVLVSFVVPYVLVALGLNVVVGMAGLLDLGYVGFFAFGAYTVGVVSSEHGSLPWILAVIVGVLVTVVSGLVLGAPTLRLRGDYLAIVTLGFGEIIRLIAQNTEWLGAQEGISPIPAPPNFGPINSGTGAPWVEFSPLEFRWYWVLGLSLIFLVILFLSRLEQSRVGRAWNAIREDEDAAELMGVPTFVFKLTAFAVGAAIGGLAGTFYASQQGAISPNTFQIQLSILFIAAVVLGGLGNKWGAVLGGVCIAYLPERFRSLELPHWLSSWFRSLPAPGFLQDVGTRVETELQTVGDKRYVIFGLALMLMMVFRPQGLLPRRLGRSTPPITKGTSRG